MNKVQTVKGGLDVNIPNALSILRILLTPLFAALYLRGQTGAAVAVLLLLFGLALFFARGPRRQARQGDEKMRRHYFGSLDTGRMVANRAFEALFDPPMTGFRSDPYDNQSGECEVEGVGLYGDALDTRKELVNYELL